MKLLNLHFFLTLLFSASMIHARQLYKVKILTPSAVEDRSRVAKFIHLDMIQDDFVVSVINRDELESIQKLNNLDIEILSSFDTDYTKVSPLDFNQMLTMNDRDERSLDFVQRFVISSKGMATIDLNNILKDKIPQENHQFSLELTHPEQCAKLCNFDKSNNLLNLTFNKSVTETSQTIEFTSPPVVAPNIHLTIQITWL